MPASEQDRREPGAVLNGQSYLGRDSPKIHKPYLLLVLERRPPKRPKAHNEPRASETPATAQAGQAQSVLREASVGAGEELQRPESWMWGILGTIRRAKGRCLSGPA